MDQNLLLFSVLIALFLMSTKEGKKMAKDVSKSVSSVTSKKSKSGFPVGLALVVVLGGLMCLSRKKLIEGAENDPTSSSTGADTVDAAAKTVDAAAKTVDAAAADANAAAAAAAAAAAGGEGNGNGNGNGEGNDYSKCLLPFIKPFCSSLPQYSKEGTAMEMWEDFETIMTREGQAWPTGCPTTPPTSLKQVKSIQLSADSRKYEVIEGRPYTCDDVLDDNSQYLVNNTPEHDKLVNKAKLIVDEVFSEKK